MYFEWEGGVRCAKCLKFKVITRAKNIDLYLKILFIGRSRDCKGPLEAVIINLSGYDVRRKKLKDTKINSRIR